MDDGATLQSILLFDQTMKVVQAKLGCGMIEKEWKSMEKSI
jgi:hypothetical protein